MSVEVYLFFNGRCEEAIAFYQQTLGATVEMKMKFSDNPEPENKDCPTPPGWADKVMHASVMVGPTRLMMSDGNTPEATQFSGFSLSLNPPDEAACHQVFAALAEGGQVTMPLTPTFWAPLFGMLTDRFGVSWMVSAPHQTA